MKIENLKRIVNGVINDGRKQRKVCTISLEGGYVSWRTYFWTDDVWEAFVVTTKGRKDIEIETDPDGDILLIFKKKGGKGSGE